MVTDSKIVFMVIYVFMFCAVSLVISGAVKVVQ